MTTTAPDRPAGAGQPTGAPVLRLTGITKRYGGVQALRGVDFDLFQGEVHALVGENGAGKSTLIKIVAGAEAPDDGRIEIDGAAQASGSTTSALGAGIATVYQEPQLFGELTVAENMFLGKELRRNGVLDRAGQRERCRELLEQIGLDPELADVRVADLAVAEQQLVSIAKALSQEPRILILDEPSAILTDREIDTLFGAIRAMRARGVAVIYISHRLDELAQITDRVTVLRDGRVVASRPTSELSVREVAELMVGHALEQDVVEREIPAAEPVLEVADLGRRGRFSEVTFAVRPGEVIALYGLVGSGAGWIARALFGIDPAEAGTIRVGGTPVTIDSPAAGVRHGITMLPANRKVQGVFGIKSIAFNISSAHLTLLSRAGLWLDRRRERGVAEDFIKRIAIKAPGPATVVGNLSGGNQQKVVLARQLVERPRILLLEEPTQGVDVGAKDEIHKIVLDLADAGSAVVVVSSDLPEALRLADRVLVVRAGRLVAEFPRGARQADVLAAAAGDEGNGAEPPGEPPAVDPSAPDPSTPGDDEPGTDS
jgi:rhamnose transport system ATP-binding protein